jgi:hypothetical protein
MERVSDSICDGRVLTLLRGWLEQDILSPTARWTPLSGTPQGAVISPLLANLYLHPLEVRRQARGYSTVRYADDCAPRWRIGGRKSSVQLAAPEMRAGPSEPAYRRRLQTTPCGCV